MRYQNRSIKVANLAGTEARTKKTNAEREQSREHMAENCKKDEKLKKDHEMSEESRLTKCCATSLERHPRLRSNARGKIWKPDNKL